MVPLPVNFTPKSLQASTAQAFISLSVKEPTMHSQIQYHAANLNTYHSKELREHIEQKIQQPRSAAFPQKKLLSAPFA
jgi:hypothetical protein